MTLLTLGTPGPGDAAWKLWVESSLRVIEQNSKSGVDIIMSEFEVTGTYTTTRTFDASTATLAELRAVLATLLADIKAGGQKAGYAT